MKKNKPKRKLFDILVHIILGFWVGLAINTPLYRHGAYLLAAYFGTYEITQAWKKGDEAYNEVKEFTIGAGAALLLRRIYQWLKEDYSNSRRVQ